MIYFKNIKNFVKNKKVFCGIDIHSYHWNLCYICDGEVMEKIRIVGNWEKLKSHTEQLFGSARSVHFGYEAGFSGFYLYLKLLYFCGHGVKHFLSACSIWLCAKFFLFRFWFRKLLKRYSY